jgi:sulfotransferase family protein
VSQAPLTFVVGTGRCGSTMLSRILHLHPDVLSVSELFVVLQAATRQDGFPTASIDGQQLWNIVAANHPILDAQIRDGLGAPELCYPYGRGRFDLATGVPLINHSTLPMLTDDPDALFDELAAEVPTWPERPATEHYRALFGWLADRLGRRVVVERSGSSIKHFALLREHFPEARFVHMLRDGPDCALSMSRHPGFRMEVMVHDAIRAAGVPPAAGWKVIVEPPPEYAGLISPPFDARRFMDYHIPAATFGRRWSDMVCAGLAEFGRVPADHWITLWFEDLLDDPGAQLSRLAEFIGVPCPPQWVREGSKLIDRSRAGQSKQLDPDTLASLRSACEPGNSAIAAAARQG